MKNRKYLPKLSFDIVLRFVFLIFCTESTLEMKFVQNLVICNVSSLQFLLLFCLLAITQSQPTITITDSKGDEYTDITMQVANGTFPATIKCSADAEWSIHPNLPKGLSTSPHKQELRISGFAKESIPKTTFTVTAVTDEGSVSKTFDLTVTGCEDGDMYNVYVNGHVQFRNQEEIVDIQNLEWVCMKRVVYAYSILEDQTYVSMINSDDNYVLILSTANKTESGSVDLTNNSPPILILPDFLQSYDESVLKIFHFSFVNLVTNVTIYPPNPHIRVSYSDITVDVISYYEANHILTLSNECGSVSKTFHMTIRKCDLGDYYNVVHLSWGDTIVVDSHNDTVYNGRGNYFCSSDTNMTLYFSESKFGVELMRPVFLYDQHGAVAEYNTDSVPATFHFYKQSLVPTFSSLRLSHSFQENWNSKSFDDSLWKEDQGQLWESFKGENVYFRKRFTIDSTENFNTILIDVLAMGDVDVYLNGEYVQHLFGRTYHQYTRFEIALEDGHIGENVFAARLHKITDDNTINFDIMIQLVYITQRLQSELGEVTQETGTPSPDPFNAFIVTSYYNWVMESAPSSLLFRFNDTEKRVVNRVYFQVPSDNFITKVKVEAIDLDENKNLTLYTSPSDFMNRFMKYRVVDFENSIAYPAYRITFESTSFPNRTEIENLRLYRDMIPTCPQTKKVPESRGNATLFSSCGLFYTGKKQTRCVIDGPKTHWEEDRSTCLSLLPPRNYAYVDYTFRLIHAIPSMFNATMKEKLVNLLIEKTAVRPEEVNMIYTMDSSDTENSSIDIFMRITVKQAGGDYIAEQLHDLKYNLTDSVQKFVAEEFDGMIIGKIRIYISWKPEIIVFIIIILLIELLLIIFAIYGVSAYTKNRKQKTKSLKRRKMNEEELLPNQELCVCSRSEVVSIPLLSIATLHLFYGAVKPFQTVEQKFQFHFKIESQFPLFIFC